MDVAEAIKTRQSCRRFSDRAVPLGVVREILETARWAPSGSNIQPWHVNVMAGEVLQGLIDRVMAQEDLFPKGEETEYAIHPPQMADPYNARRIECAERMYASMGVTRDDRAGRIRQFADNFSFFGAPVGLMFTIDRSMGPGHWGDLGMFIQSIMLTARSHGLHTCPQQAWARWHKTVSDYLDIPENRMIYCGMALGHMAEDHPINRWRTDRRDVDDIASFAGFDAPAQTDNSAR